MDGVTIIKNHCVEFATKTVRMIGFCPLAFLIDIGLFISYFSFLYSCSENCTDTDGKFELSFFFSLSLMDEIIEELKREQLSINKSTDQFRPIIYFNK